MADPLDSARIKLQRAHLHAGIARREARRFFRKHGDPTVGLEPEGDHSNLGIGSLFTVKTVVKKGWPPLPPQFSARFADAIHNYRCVLDHVAWQLVSHGLRPPSKLRDDEQRLVQFPIYTAEQGFDSRVAVRLPGVDPAVTDFIKTRHVYVRRKATNNALLRLADLSNDDKHKTLPLIASAFLNVQTQVGQRDCQIVRFWNPPIVPPAVTDGAVIGLFECVITGPRPNVSVKFQPTLHIALEGGAGFGDVLAEIEAEIKVILNAPEITAAIG